MRPRTTGSADGLPADPPNPANRPSVALEEPVRTPLRGASARTVKNMDLSLAVPTATSVRSLPVKLLIDQRVVINNHLRRARGGKVSYTHLIGFAMVQALKAVPAMNAGYEVVDGKPTMVVPQHVNLGLAIDLPKEDGTRQLLVPSIKNCETLDFAQFWAAYEEAVRRARRLGTAPSFARADAENLPFADGSFTGAVCGGSLNEFGDPARVLRETRRVLAPGGRVAIMGILKAKTPRGRRLQRFLSTGGVRFFAPEEVESLLDHAGLAPDPLQTYGAVFFAGSTRR